MQAWGISMIRVLECFAGLGACSKALTNLGIEHEIVDAVEIDKYAVKSFNAVHGTSFEPQDITKWDKDIECDLIMHGSPCQDFSVAGKGAGGDKDSGTRSSLMYETLRIVEKLKPKYVIWENVKNLLSAKHRHNFDAYLEAMERLGYRSQYQVLNAKDYGVPQNRERVFTVSIRKDIYNGYFFPAPIPLEKRLKDVLEGDVDEKYYLSDERVAGLIASTEKERAKGNGFKFEPIEKEKIAHAISTKAGGRKTDNVIDEGGVDHALRLGGLQGGNLEPFIVASRGRNPNNPSDRTTGAPTVQRLEPRKDCVTNTITSVQKDNYVANSLRIRKLTPKECWRLMGFDDDDFKKAQSAGISNSQLYKQAGNSIVVNVLEGILRNLPIDQ